jgi:hypothetical protein
MANPRICPYCNNMNHPDNPACLACGGPLGSTDLVNEERTRGMPFAYNGYIVWPLVDWARAVDEFHFYLGLELQGIVEFPHHLQRELVPMGTEYMPLVWDLFLLGRGEQETVVWQVEPFEFKIICRDRRWNDDWDFFPRSTIIYERA